MSLQETKSPSHEDRWVTIYPAFINAKKKVKEGRRINRELAVENPTCQEINDILKNAGFNVRTENKMYPRDPSRDLHHQGRVRVQLRDENGEPFSAEFPTRQSLLKMVAETIPKLKSRASKVPAQQTAQSQGKTQGKKKKR